MADGGTILLEPAASMSSSGLLSAGESHFREAFAKIDGMRKSGALLCDVTVVFGNGNHIKAHKLVLASSSKFFRTLFVDPTLGFSSVIKVQDSSEEVGHLLIEFAYTAHLDIDEFNVIEILHGAEKLGFEQVERLCIEALRSRLDLNRVQGMDLPNLIDLVNRFGQQDILPSKDPYQRIVLHQETHHHQRLTEVDQKEQFAVSKSLPLVAFTPEHHALHSQSCHHQPPSQTDPTTATTTTTSTSTMVPMAIIQQEMELCGEGQQQQQQQHPPTVESQRPPTEPPTTFTQLAHLHQPGLPLTPIQHRPLPSSSSQPPPQQQNQHQAHQPMSHQNQRHQVQHQQQQPVYVELSPGHIVLMTATGSIRKIRLSDEVLDGEPEALTLREGADTSTLATAEVEGGEITGEDVKLKAEADSSESLTNPESTKRRKPTTKKKSPSLDKKSRIGKNPAAAAALTVSDFDRKLRTLSLFEQCLSEASLKSVLMWQSEPLKRRRVLCALCPLTVSGTYHDLMEHVWKEHGPDAGRDDGARKKAVCCKICNEKFSHRVDLLAHNKNVHRGFDCKFCGKESSSPPALKAHETCCEKNPAALPASDCSCGVVPRKTRIPCDDCGKTFSNPTSLNTHVNLLHGDGTAVAPPGKKTPVAFCVTCQKSFSNKSVLDSHVRMVHLGEKEIPKPCPDCGKHYTMRAMREHRKRDHQGLRYQCPDCPSARLFTTKIMLTRHREVVHQKRRFRCTLCLAEFVDRCAWKLHHEAEHVGRRYPCPQCSKQFKRPGDVRRHIREVHQKCRYTCQHCEKSFSQQAKLKLHIRSLHLGNYPHTCSVCGKGFLRPGTLKGHVAKEHAELLLIKESLVG